MINRETERRRYIEKGMRKKRDGEQNTERHK
jgi:hypothetical protein